MVFLFSHATTYRSGRGILCMNICVLEDGLILVIFSIRCVWL